MTTDKAPASNVGQVLLGRTFSRRQVCDRYGVRLETMCRENAKGRGPRPIRIGKALRYTEEELLRWEREQQDTWARDRQGAEGNIGGLK